jgi:hypothetical protein
MKKLFLAAIALFIAASAVTQSASGYTGIFTMALKLL